MQNFVVVVVLFFKNEIKEISAAREESLHSNIKKLR